MPPAGERRLCCWPVAPHVRSQRKGNERYLARRRSNGEERDELVVVVFDATGITVENDDDCSSGANR